MRLLLASHGVQEAKPSSDAPRPAEPVHLDVCALIMFLFYRPLSQNKPILDLIHVVERQEDRYYFVLKETISKLRLLAQSGSACFFHQCIPDISIG